MDLFWVVCFLVMYYLKPQEWYPFLASIKFAQIVMMGAIVSLAFREKRVRLGNIVRTPHDWMILLFWAAIIFSGPSWWTNFKDSYPLILTYFIIVQALCSLERIRTFVGWWTFLVVAIAGLAVASTYGFDPLSSNDITQGRMKGRLILNLSMFNNPNGLGHAVVPAIPMLYYFCIWKRPLFMKEIGFACLILPCYCIYLTLSKGAFLSGGTAILATLTFGRPKALQVAIVVCAVAYGGTALWMLPRMQELNRAGSDEAIKGRVAAFTHGLKIMEDQKRGIGYRQWLKHFFRAHRFNKAAHSSYVQIGSELGIIGFAIFLGILYCNLRTLFTAQTKDQEEERIRRVLFVLVISYAVSSWMVDMGYRVTFFMFTAAIAAYHRHMLKLNDETPEELAEASGALVPAVPAWRARFVEQPAMEAAFAGAGDPKVVVSLEPVPTAEQVAVEDDDPRPGITGGWNRITLVDIGITIALTFVALRFWKFVLIRMSN